MAFEGLEITSTGFQGSVKAEIVSIVERLGGTYSPTFHEGISHCVARSCLGSRKYRVAVGWNL